MTFVEAAIEILKREGKPMSTRRLAELAVKLNLLSVVGRDPEATMQQRLDDALGRAARHPDLVRLKADTFGLHAYPDKPYPSNGNGAHTAAAAGVSAGGAAAGGEAGGEPKKGRRRRRRGGRRGGAEGAAGEGQAAATGEEAEDAGDESDEEGGGVSAGAESDAAPAAAAAAGEGGEAAAEAAADEGAAGEGAAGEGEAGEGAAGEGAAGAGRRRRRRGGRGRRRREGAEGASPAGAAAAGEEDVEDEDEDEAEAGATKHAAGATKAVPDELPSEAAAAGTSEETIAADATEGGSSDEDGGDEAAAEAAGGERATDEPGSDEPGSDEPSSDEDVADAAAQASGDDGGDDAELLDDDTGEELEEDIDHDTGPLMAPAFGAEDVTRTDDDRTVRPEIRGSRDDRHRRDRHKGGGRDRDRHRKPEGKGGEHKPAEHRAGEHRGEHRGGEHKAGEHRGEHRGEHKAGEHRGGEHKPAEHRGEHRGEHRAAEHKGGGEPRAPEPRPLGPGASLVDVVLELLRGSDGRPMHVRHLVETAVKRKLVDERTPQNDLIRLARAALLREQREREAEGLRPRLRPLGGGHYGTVDRKLDPELLTAERDLGERAARLRDATRTAIRRRLQRMSPGAFDALGRTLCDKLGITGLELLRRGEGVTYWGGGCFRGVGIVRTLVSLRPGEAEITRRAVGELRAGLAAKGYDEGLLLSAGRPNAEALAELKAGGVRLYDGAALAGLLMKHGLGVRRVAMPVDYLDLDFFGELQES